MLLKTDWSLERGQPAGGVVQLQPLAQGERDVRRRDLRHFGQRHRRRPGAHQRAQRQLVHDDCREPAERVPLHLLARDPAADGRTPSNLAADTGMGFAPTFRFGNPFFLQPNVDELIWRRADQEQLLDRRAARHTFKVGGEWMHTLNDQVFRGFFTGRYLFDSVDRVPALHVAGGAGRIRSVDRRAARAASYVTAAHALPGGHDARRAGRCCSICRARAGPGSRPTRPAPRQSPTRSSRSSCRTSGRWAPGLTLDYGLRWDAQLMPETVDPETTAYAALPDRSGVPVRRHDSRTSGHVAAAGGIARGICDNDGKSVVRGQRRRLLRAPEHAQPGRFGHDQRPPAADDLREHGLASAVRHADADVAGRAHAERRCPAGTFPLFTGVRVFHRDYQNPRIYTVNVGYEREIAPDCGGYVDFTVRQGHATSPASSTTTGPVRSAATRALAPATPTPIRDRRSGRRSAK